MIAVLDVVETSVIAGLDVECLSIITMKLASPKRSWLECAGEVWDNLSPTSLNSKINDKRLGEAYRIILEHPTIAGQLMLTSLYPYAIGSLLLIANDEDERANVRVTASKELIRLGSNAETKLAGMNERIDESALHTKDLLD